MTVETYEAGRVDSWVHVVKPVAELAAAIADTELVPAALRRRPDAIAAVILFGRELGLPPMTALRTVFIAEGKPALYAEAMLALVLRAGHSVEYVESTSARCVVRGHRIDDTATHEVTWTLEDARRAGLAGKAWTKYPRAMLKHRATAELCRDLFPDVTSGMSAVEELGEDETAGPPSETKGARSTVRRKRPAPAEIPLPPPDITVDPAGAEPPPSTPSGPSAPEPEPDPVGKALETARAMLGARELVDVDLPPADDFEPYTSAQQRAMHAAFNELGVTDRQARLDYTSAIIRRDIKSANELSTAEASMLLDALRLAQESDEPLATLDEARRGWGLVVDEPLPLQGLDE